MPGGMATRKPYPSDLSDARWALIQPTLTAWRQRERRAGLSIGRPPRHDLRSVLDPRYVGQAREVATQMTKVAESRARAADLLEDAAR